MARQSGTGTDMALSFQEESGAVIPVSGKRFRADPSGALYWPDQNTLIVSDLHLEKGKAVEKKARLLPPYDTRATLVRLAAAIDRYDPDRIVALGGSFADAKTAGRLARVDRERLCILRQGREWYWVSDHDSEELPDWLGGIVCPVLTLDGISFRHEPEDGVASREVAGFLHPCASFPRRGAEVWRKCFVSNGARLVVPAFGASAGGRNVRDETFSALFGGGEAHAWLLGREQVYPMAVTQLLDG